MRGRSPNWPYVDTNRRLSVALVLLFIAAVIDHTQEGRLILNFQEILTKFIRQIFYMKQLPSHIDLVSLSSELVFRKTAYEIGGSLIYCKTFFSENDKYCYVYYPSARDVDYIQASGDFGCRVNLCWYLSNHIR